MFAFLNANTNLHYIIITLVILGFGFAFFTAPNNNAIMGSVDKRFYGVASAIVGTMRQVGVTFSMGIIMMLFSIFIGRVQLLQNITSLSLRLLRSHSLSIRCFVLVVYMHLG